MDNLTGFDSEADRRDAIRKRIVDTATTAVYETIRDHAVTRTRAERRLLEIRIVQRLMHNFQTDMQAELFGEEIEAATKRIDG